MFLPTLTQPTGIMATHNGRQSHGFSEGRTLFVQHTNTRGWTALHMPKALRRKYPTAGVSQRCKMIRQLVHFRTLVCFLGEIQAARPSVARIASLEHCCWAAAARRPAEGATQDVPDVPGTNKPVWPRTASKVLSPFTTTRRQLIRKPTLPRNLSRTSILPHAGS